MPTSVANTTANQTAVDKLNSYRTSGNLLRLSNESSTGTFRTGLWSDYAKSYRFQVPANPLTWQDNAVPNFSETYQTTTLQPFAEFEFKVTDDLTITPGVKYAFYHQHFNHLADNGGAVGNLNGAPSVTNTVSYHDVLPSLDLH
jgi:iron complex outermembrane receptor protein